MTNPKSRIQALKQEIADIGKILQQSSETAPRFQPDLPVRKPQQEKQEFDLQMNRMTISQASKQDYLKKQLADLQSKLASIRKLRQQASLQHRSKVEPLKSKVQSMQNTLNRLNKEYHSYSISINWKTKQDSVFQAKMNLLTATEKKIQGHKHDKEKGSKLLRSLKEQARALENRINLCKEEILTRLNDRAEYVAEREETQERLEHIKLRHGGNIQHNHAFGRLHTKIQEAEEQVLVFDKKQIAMEKRMEDLNSQYQYNWSQIVKFFSGTSSTSISLEKAEIALESRSTKEGLLGLYDLMLEINKFQGFDLDQTILRIQMELVSQKEKKHREQQLQQEKKINEQIQNSDFQKARDLQQKYHKMRKKHKLEQVSIDIWRTEVQKALQGNGNNNLCPVNDSQIINEFKMSLCSKIHPRDHKSIQLSLNKFSQTLQTWYNSIQNRTEIFQKLQKKKLKLQNYIQNEKKDQKKLLQQQATLLQRFQVLKQLANNTQQTQNPLNHIRSQAQNLQKDTKRWQTLIAHQTNTIECILRPNHQQAKADLLAILEQIKQTQNSIRASDSSIQANSIQKDQFQQQKKLHLQEQLDKVVNENPRVYQLKKQIERLTQELEHQKAVLEIMQNQWNEKYENLQHQETMMKSKEEALQINLNTISSDKKRLQDMQTRLYSRKQTEPNVVNRISASPIPQMQRDVDVRNKAVNRSFSKQRQVRNRYSTNPSRY